ncbi:MAG: hypothetical protein NTU74_14005 [Deltaproteobacteria bacterium]|nr:hypothetical protein [Deltaproteobacteria bacterium]
MLYKLGQKNGIFDSITPVTFHSSLAGKHLENLVSEKLLEVFFENELMPIFQDRSRKAEADTYALNRKGELVIFDQKRVGVGGSAVHQGLHYCETAAHWSFDSLQKLLAKYSGVEDVNLQKEHQNKFNLERPLEKSAFNSAQHLIVVGCAGDDELIRNIDYWKSKGLSLDFIPYRIYKIGDENYFEFFSIPYDRHLNPAGFKGVIFDTCRKQYPESIWYMCDNNRVAAFGDQQQTIHCLNRNDIVFLYHKYEGIVAAGRVKGDVKSDPNVRDALYRDLEWLTPKPERGAFKSMPAMAIKSILGHNFFWAKTIKIPYLGKKEAEKLLKAFKQTLIEP